MLNIQLQGNRTVVGAEDVGEDFGGFYFLSETLRYEKVIQAPADVARTRVGKVRPPCIVPLALGE